MDLANRGRNGVCVGGVARKKELAEGKGQKKKSDKQEETDRRLWNLKKKVEIVSSNRTLKGDWQTWSAGVTF